MKHEFVSPERSHQEEDRKEGATTQTLPAQVIGFTGFTVAVGRA